MLKFFVDLLMYIYQEQYFHNQLYLNNSPQDCLSYEYLEHLLVFSYFLANIVTIIENAKF